jgi:hypothetical protein
MNHISDPCRNPKNCDSSRYENALARGRLKRAIALAWPQAFAYWVVLAESRADEPRIAAFREWALAEGRDAIAIGKRGGARYGRRALKRPTL